MNSIKALLDKNDFVDNSTFLNFQIDGCWFNENLDTLYPDKIYKGLIPTLLGMDFEKEEEIVWNRILPEPGHTKNCPVLMCPDDCDFSCTLIIAEIENTGSSIKWNKIGINDLEDYVPENVGARVQWFDKIESLEFRLTEYQIMLDDFKRYFDSNNP